MYVITYDIVNDKRRAKLSQTLKDYGVRVQYSVFESDITPDEAEKLKKYIAKIINLREDSVKFYYIDNRCEEKMETLGKKVVTEFAEYYDV
jgi:CRISPR-associated protein Cas2